MTIVPGLRSPRETVGGLVYFARMLDKVRLHAAGRLPADYIPNLGTPHPRVFDAVCCGFLGVNYEELKARVLAGGTDEEHLAWCQSHGSRRSAFDFEMFNAFLAKRGWKDEVSERLQTRIREYGAEDYRVDTFFDLFDADEGRGVAKDSRASAT